MALDRISDEARASATQLAGEIQVIFDEIEPRLSPGPTGALGDPGSQGIVVRTTVAGATVARSLIGPAAGFAISNNDGVAGNPTFALNHDLAAVEALSTTGFVKRTATDTWSTSATVSLSSEVSGSLPWASVDKTGSSLADLTTRSGSDLNAGTVAVTRGGTGAGSFTSNAVLYGNGSSAIQALAVNSSGTNKFLTQSSSGAPAWASIFASDISSLAVTWSATQTFTLAPVVSALTSGSVLFAGAAGLLSQDNAYFYWNATTHRLGIGTSGPSRAVTIQNPSASTNSQLLYLKQAADDYGYSLNVDDLTTGRLFIRGVTAGVEATILTLDRVTGGVSVNTINGLTITANGSNGLNISAGQTLAIASGGSLALAGFTGTLPATGTISMGAGSLSVSSLNSTSSANHTHAITSSSNPGAVASLLSTDGSGYLTTVRHTVTDYLFVNSATANLYLKDTSTGWRSAASGIVTPQNNNSIRSSSFTSGIVGWGINAAGDAEFNNITTRGELRASTFKYSEITATAGTFGVFRSASTIIDNYMMPSVGGAFTISVKNADSGGNLFAVGDTLRLKAFVNSGGFVTADAWVGIETLTNQGVYTDYTVRMKAGSAGATFYKGTAIVDYGVSGDGFITLSADGTIGSSPNLTMGTHAGSPWSSQTILLRLGNLNGSYGYASDVYGFGVGQYGTTNQPSILVDSTSGIRILGGASGTTQLGQWDTSGTITIGQVSAGQSNVVIAAGALDLRVNTTIAIHLASSGSGYLANNLFSWDAAGNVTISGNAAIASWTITTSRLSSTNVFLDQAGQYLSMGTTPPTSYGSAAGVFVEGANGGRLSLYNNATNYLQWDSSKLLIKAANFTLDSSGNVTATSATLQGAITATSGAITGALTMDGVSSAIAIGSTPPSSSTSGTGIWLDRTGLYSLSSGVYQVSITAGGSVTFNLAASSGVSWSNASATPIGINGAEVGGVTTLTASVQGTTANPASRMFFSAFTLTGSATTTLVANSASSTSDFRVYNSAGTLAGFIIGANATPSAMLEVRGSALITGSLGATSARLVKGWFTDLEVSNTIVGSISGNAASASLLATARNINGVSFNGSADITVTAAAGTLTGATLNSGVTASSLTSLGTLVSNLNLTKASAVIKLDASDSNANLQFASSGTVVAQLAIAAGDFYFDYVGSLNLRGGFSGTTRFTLSAAGSLRLNAYGAGTLVTDASGNVTASSDERLKTLHGSFTKGLKELRGIKPVLYSWQPGHGTDDTRTVYAGFTTQNVGSLIPEAVFFNPRTGYGNLWDRAIHCALVNGVNELASKSDRHDELLLEQRLTIKELSARVLELEDLIAAKSDNPKQL